MSEPNDPSATNPSPPENSAKKPYTAPQLTKRGTVAELTQGGGSVIDDGGGTLEGHV
jgi:hypothetical protein